MSYVSDVAWGKRVVPKKKFYDRFKTKASKVGNTLGKNIKYMSKVAYNSGKSQAKKIQANQRSQGGFYSSHKNFKPKINQVRKIKYFKKKGKKFIPVFKKSKHKVKIQRVQNNYNPFNLDF
jgi:hypothetical protein